MDTKNTRLYAFFALCHLRETVPFILQKEDEGYKKHNIVYFLFLCAICVRPYLLFHRKKTKDTKEHDVVYFVFLCTLCVKLHYYVHHFILYINDLLWVFSFQPFLYDFILQDHFFNLCLFKV